MKRAYRHAVQPSTAEHISELLKAENAQAKPPAYTVLSGVAKPVIELLYKAFDGWQLAMVDFFERILLNYNGVNCERHYIVLTALQHRFLEVFLEHCRELGLEPHLEQPQAAAPTPASAAATTTTATTTRQGESQLLQPSSGTTAGTEVTKYAQNETMPVGAKRVLKKRNSVAKSFYASHRLRIRFVTTSGAIVDRDYETSASIKAICHSLCDKRFMGKVERLIEIPNVIYRALIDSGSVCKTGQNGPKLRRDFIRDILSPKARVDPWIEFQFRCPFVYEISLIDADVRRKNTQIETCKRLKLIHDRQAAEAEAAAASASAALQGEQSPVTQLFDIERLTLAIYVYYRLQVSRLTAQSTQIESAFALVMYLFEETISQAKTQSGLVLANTASIETAKRDIALQPYLFERVLKVAEDAVRFVLSRTTAASENPQHLQPPTPPKTLTMIYDAAVRLKIGIDRIKAIDRAREDFHHQMHRMYFWQRNLQVSWRLVELEFLKHYAPARAQQVRAFATEFPDCCAFMLDPRVTPETFLRSIRHLNRMHPSFRFTEVGYQDEGNVRVIKNPGEFLQGYATRYRPEYAVATSGEDDLEGIAQSEIFLHESTAIAAGLRSGSTFCIMTDGSSHRSFILFDTPRSHQRFCNFSVMESLTTPRQEKHLMLYPFLMRQYGGVFGHYEWAPTDMSRLAQAQSVYAKVLANDFGERSVTPQSTTTAAEDAYLRPVMTPERIDEVNFNDDHENLWLFVRTLFFQLCSYAIVGIDGCKRLADSLLCDVLHGHERDFRTYRLVHRICSTLDDYMDDFPYFVNKNEGAKRPHPASMSKAEGVRDKHRPAHVIDDLSLLESRSKALTYVCEIVLCFLCLGAVHTLAGDTVWRLRNYLACLKPPLYDRHVGLRIYLELLDASTENRHLIVEGETCKRIQLTFDRELAREFNFTLRAPGVFDDLLEPQRFGQQQLSNRRDVARINRLLYLFVVDEALSIDIRGQVLFDVDHQRQEVLHAAYVRQSRASGSHHLMFSKGSTPNSTASLTPSTPQRNDDVEMAYIECGDDAAPSAMKASRVPAVGLTINAIFKKPEQRTLAKRIRTATDDSHDDDDDDVSDDTSAAVHASEVLGSRSAVAHPVHPRLSASTHRIARITKLHNAAPEDVQQMDLPLRSIEREVPFEYDIYRGLTSIRACAPLKQLCSSYQDALCYDLVYDFPRSIVFRGLEAAVQAFERKASETKAARQQQKIHAKKQSLVPADAPDDDAALEQFLEREHRHIIGSIARITPPAIVKGMYFGRGMKGKASDFEEMQRAYLQVMDAAKMTIVSEPQGRDPFKKGCYTQRAPIAYTIGTYESIGLVMGSLTHIGKWRYEMCADFRVSALMSTCGLEASAIEPEVQSCSFEPMSRFLRSLEWMLYHRCYSLERVEQHRRKLDDELNSNKFWLLDADRFMWYQLNSKLPVDFNPLSYNDILAQYCDDQVLKEELREEREKRRAAKAAKIAAGEKVTSEDSSSSSGDEDSSDEFIDDILFEEIMKANDPQQQPQDESDKGLVGGELADVVDHFWTTNDPFSFIDNSGWTMRISSQEKEAEGEVERGGPSVTDGLTMVLDEYSQTLRNLVYASVNLPEKPVEHLPTAKFLKEHLEAAKKSLIERLPAATIAILSGAAVASSMSEDSSSDTEDTKKVKKQRSESNDVLTKAPTLSRPPPPPPAAVEASLPTSLSIHKDPVRPQQRPVNGSSAHHGPNKRLHQRSPPRRPDSDTLSIADFTIDTHGSNMASMMPTFQRKDATQQQVPVAAAAAAAMQWPGQLYMGERTAAATRDKEKLQVAANNAVDPPHRHRNGRANGFHYAHT